MANDETEIKEFVEQYIKVLTSGKTKFIEENVDIQAMYEKDGEIFGKWGLSKKMSVEEYAERFKSTLSMMRRGWDKTFVLDSFEIKGDEAIIQINAEGMKSRGQPLILKKIENKWKLIWIPTWSF
ncbi:MAG: nuclear transport factor 2 family protein [Candidatus Helarchaeota archaeon]|nr:nuclear transport factor 2 family protein [Candidatus Helarchaeota archaeon]